MKQGNELNERLTRLSPAQRRLLEKRLRETGKQKAARNIILKRENPTVAPLSFSQQRLWMSEQIEGHESLYNNPFGKHIRGNLDVRLLEQAVNTIIRRHDVFRSVLDLSGGVPVIRTLPPQDLPLRVMDIGNQDKRDPSDKRDEAGQREDINRILKAEGSEPFNLQTGPLIRHLLLKVSESHFILLVTAHHLVTDGWTKSLYFKELYVLYTAFSQGKPSPLPPPALQYGDFADWQRRRFDSGLWQKHLDYWEKQLAELPRVEFPTDFPRPRRHTVEGKRYAFDVPASLTAHVFSFKDNRQVTLFITLLTAFNLLLSRYSGSSDIVLGTPIAGRQPLEVEPLMGCFFNNLVLRTDASGNPGAQVFLRRTRDTALAAYEHQDIPYDKLVELVRQPRDASRAPLFQVLFHMRNFPSSGPPPPGLEFDPLELEVDTVPFDISMEIETQDAGIRCAMDYNIQLFSPRTIERLAGHYLNLLEGLVHNPDLPVAFLPLLSKEEQRQILEEWNGSRADFPENTPVQRLFEAHAERTPHAVAAVLEDRFITYACLNTAACDLARRLQKLRVGPGTIVGLYVDRSLEMLTGILGILKAGAAYLPLDPAYPGERISYMLADGNADVLVTTAALSGRNRTAGPRRDKTVLIPSPCPRSHQSVFYQARTDGADIAYIIYTSGSTGKPRGVMINHGNLSGFLHGFRRVTLPDPSVRRVGTSVGSFSFDLSVEEIFSCLCFGGTVHVVQPENSSNAEYFARYLVDRCINVGFILPALLEPVARVLAARRHMYRTLPLTCLLTGISPIKKRQLQLFRDLSASLRIINAYGPTEVTYGAAVFAFQQAADAEAEEDVPIGKAFPNYGVYVVDEYLQPVPVGVTGEILICGAGVGAGYLNRPELTSQRYCRKNFLLGGEEVVYRTGDMGRYLPDGNILFLGRKDQQVKIRGFRVEPEEVEKRLAQHPQVHQAVVIALAPGNASADPRLTAYIVPPEGQTAPSGSALRAYLKETLPDYMVPSFFIALGTLPLTANGKLDIPALPRPDSRRTDALQPFQPPVTPLEKKLAAVWAERLGIAIDQLSIDDDFFELGGHSLVGTQILAQTAAETGARLQLRQLFETPTIRGLAAYIESRETTPPKPAETKTDGTHGGETTEDGGALPLSFGQQRLWFIQRLEPQNPVYNFIRLYRLTGSLDITCLQKSLDTVVSRHQVLHTVFDAPSGFPVAVLKKDIFIPIKIIDLQTLSPRKQEAEIRERALEEVRRPFDLARGPLMRFILFGTGPQTYVLLWITHHIVSDGWSIGVFFRELSTFYNAFLEQKRISTTPLPLQYTDITRRQQERLESGEFAAHINYWKDKLAGVTIGSPMPADRPRPAKLTYAGGRYAATLPGPVLRDLRQLGRRENATLFMVLLAAFNVLLYRYSGRDDITVGTPIANRDDPGGKDLIGFFANTLVLRNHMSGAETFKTLLARVRTTCLEAYTHGDMPFEKLVEVLNPPRDLSLNPFFQVMLVLQNMPPRQLQFSGITARPVEFDRRLANFDMTLFAEEQTSGLTLYVEYNSDLYNAESVKRWVDYYTFLLAHVSGETAALQCGIDMLPLTDEREQMCLLREWNKTETVYPGGLCAHHLFERQAERTPAAAAVVMDDRTLTYGELNRRADGVARYLEFRGQAPGTLVGICMKRSIEMVIAVLGILKAGCGYLPLDPAYPAGRTRYILADADAPLLFTDASPEEEDGPFSPGYLQSLPRESAGSAESIVYVIYTSGTTGKPKGVMMKHGSVVNLVHWHRGHPLLSRVSRTLQFASLAFDVSFQEIFSTWSAGGTLFLVKESVRSDPHALWQYIGKHQIDRIFLPGAVLEQMAPAAEGNPRVPLFLREIISAGDRLRVNPALSRLFRRLPDCTLHNQYGPTETHVVTEHVLSGPAVDWPFLPPIGRPIANNRIYILDSYHRPVPVGIPGEIYIVGEGMAAGYLNKPQLTSEKFIEAVIGGESLKLYKTGDTARYQEDGAIQFLGRSDHQVKISGFRIEPAEVEYALKQHPAVKEAVAVPWGSIAARRRLAAYIVPAGDNIPDTSQIRDFLKHSLPRYMVPFSFIFMKAFPLTSGGKIDHAALPEPVPADAGRLPGESDTAPRDALEKKLCKIWGKLLHVHNVGIRDDFFDLGGYSLLAIRLVYRVEKIFGRRLPVSSLFEAPTVEKFAALVREDGASVLPSSLLLIRPGGAKPPVFFMHHAAGGVLDYHQLARRIDPGHPVYGIHAKVEGQTLLAYKDIDKAARYYAEVITAFIGNDPVLLVGHSFGGIVALETARELMRRDRKVGLLGVIDVRAPGTHWLAWYRLPGFYIRTYAERAWFHFHRLAAMSWRKRWSYTLLKLNVLRTRFMKQLKKVFAGMRPSRGGKRGGGSSSHGAIAKLLSESGFVRDGYPGLITLFKASIALPVLEQEDYGWGKYAHGGVQVHVIRGEHGNLIKEPYAEELALKLNTCIRGPIPSRAAPIQVPPITRQ